MGSIYDRTAPKLVDSSMGSFWSTMGKDLIKSVAESEATKLESKRLADERAFKVSEREAGFQQSKDLEEIRAENKMDQSVYDQSMSTAINEQNNKASIEKQKIASKGTVDAAVAKGAAQVKSAQVSADSREDVAKLKTVSTEKLQGLDRELKKQLSASRLKVDKLKIERDSLWKENKNNIKKEFNQGILRLKESDLLNTIYAARQNEEIAKDANAIKLFGILHAKKKASKSGGVQALNLNEKDTELLNKVLSNDSTMKAMANYNGTESGFKIISNALLKLKDTNSKYFMKEKEYQLKVQEYESKRKQRRDVQFYKTYKTSYDNKLKEMGQLNQQIVSAEQTYKSTFADAALDKGVTKDAALTRLKLKEKAYAKLQAEIRRFREIEDRLLNYETGSSVLDSTTPKAGTGKVLALPL